MRLSLVAVFAAPYCLSMDVEQGQPTPPTGLPVPPLRSAVFGASPIQPIPDPVYGAETISGTVHPKLIEDLVRARPWVVFFCIVTFVSAGLQVLTALALGGLVAALACVPIAGLFVYPGLLQWRHAQAVSRLAVSRASVDRQAALAYRTRAWRYGGVAFLIGLTLYTLFFFLFWF